MTVGRRRLVYAALALLTILLGLLSRSSSVVLPAFIATYAGDTLWALMVFWLIATVANRRKTSEIALAALIFAFGIELSQLSQASWLQQLRHTRWGGLVLGYGFMASDLVCYVVGVSIGAVLDTGLQCKVVGEVEGTTGTMAADTEPAEPRP